MTTQTVIPPERTNEAKERVAVRCSALVRRLASFRYRYIYHPLWFFGHWIQRYKWKTGKRWLEMEYIGAAFKHFSWALGHLNQWELKKSKECFRWTLRDIKIVGGHRRRRLSAKTEIRSVAD